LLSTWRAEGVHSAGSRERRHHEAAEGDVRMAVVTEAKRYTRAVERKQLSKDARVAGRCMVSTPVRSMWFE
jgi:hypothetical protein